MASPELRALGTAVPIARATSFKRNAPQPPDHKMRPHHLVRIPGDPYAPHRAPRASTDGPRHLNVYRSGPGVCAALLIRGGIPVVSQRDLRTLALFFRKLGHEELGPPEAAHDHHESEWYRGYFGAKSPGLPAQNRSVIRSPLPSAVYEASSRGARKWRGESLEKSDLSLDRAGHGNCAPVISRGRGRASAQR
jgi:hypothetical protein